MHEESRIFFLHPANWGAAVTGVQSLCSASAHDRLAKRDLLIHQPIERRKLALLRRVVQPQVSEDCPVLLGT